MIRTVFLLATLVFTISAFAQIGIGTNNPNSKSLLDLSSTDKGLLLPRMTAVQRLAINPAGPARGLMVFDTDSTAFMFWTGTAWQRIASGAGSNTGNFWALGGNTLAGTEKLGSTNNKSLILIGTGVHMMRFDTGRLGTVPLPRITGGSELNLISGGAANTIINGGGIEEQKNQIGSGNWNTIGNGANNSIELTHFATILSGNDNSISRQVSTGFNSYGLIGGGSDHRLKSNYGFIGMGVENFVDDDYGFIGNGKRNKVLTGADYSFIGSGDSNVVINATYSFVGGGSFNIINAALNNVISGGFRNRIESAEYSHIGGGARNILKGNHSVVSGGAEDSVFANYSMIGGGIKNYIAPGGHESFIGGGDRNKIGGVGTNNTIVGGLNNKLEGNLNFIGGGQINVAEGNSNTIVGGGSNRIHTTAESDFIGGGGANYINSGSQFSSVMGGFKNGIGGNLNSVSGGAENFVEGGSSAIVGGMGNMLLSSYSLLGGGKDNFIDGGSYSILVGGQQNLIKSNHGFLGGGYRNQINENSNYSTLVGGDSNRILPGVLFGAIAGGKSNVLHAAGDFSVLGGGQLNRIEKTHSVIAGGLNNWSRGEYSSIVGGNTNEAGGDYSAVIGGGGNTVAGDYSSVLGGRFNQALGNYSVSSGYRSNIIHSSNFIYADFRGFANSFDSKNEGQFMARVLNGALFTDEDTSTVVRAQLHARSKGSTPQLMADQVEDDFSRIRLRSGNAVVNHWDIAAKASDAEFNIFRNGTGNILKLTPISATNLLSMSNGARLTAGGTWTNASDRNIKDNISQIDGAEILEKLAAMPVSEWHYKTEADSVTHIGPMAQDFKAAFGLGDSDKSIATVDADGVNMAAIQALYKRLLALEKQNKQLESEIKALKINAKQDN